MPSTALSYRTRRSSSPRGHAVTPGRSPRSSTRDGNPPEASPPEASQVPRNLPTSGSAKVRGDLGTPAGPARGGQTPGGPSRPPARSGTSVSAPDPTPASEPRAATSARDVLSAASLLLPGQWGCRLPQRPAQGAWGPCGCRRGAACSPPPLKLGLPRTPHFLALPPSPAAGAQGQDGAWGQEAAHGVWEGPTRARAAPWGRGRSREGTAAGYQLRAGVRGWGAMPGRRGPRCPQPSAVRGLAWIRALWGAPEALRREGPPFGVRLRASARAAGGGTAGAGAV